MVFKPKLKPRENKIIDYSFVVNPIIIVIMVVIDLR